MKRFIQQKEDGFVSLFSTIFFMLLITVVTIGFIQIMAVEQQQSLNNDLSASALASAQSGIEDGKRAILKYYSLTNPSDKATYYAQMTFPNAQNCNSISGSQVGADLGIDSAGNVVNNAQINQSYTCLTVNLNSPDYISQSPAGKSQLIPLKAVGGSFQRIKVSWHLLSANVGADGDGLPGSPPGTAPFYATGPLLFPQTHPDPDDPSWSNFGYPAYLRAQLYGYPNSGGWDRAHLNERSRSVLLVPQQSGQYDQDTPINFGTADPNPGGFGTAQILPSGVSCDATPNSHLGAYACTALLELPTGAQYASTANTYFLRLTPIYGQTHFRVALVNNGNEVQFDQVQPIIDVTGRANDIYRRLQARVQVNQATNFPEFATESADSICKNLRVSSQPADYKPNICP